MDDFLWSVVAAGAFLAGVCSNEDFRREHRRNVRRIERHIKKIEKRLYKR